MTSVKVWCLCSCLVFASYSHLQAASYDKTQLRTFRKDSTLSLMLRCRARRTASIHNEYLQWSIIIEHIRTGMWSTRFQYFFKHYRPCVYELFEPSRSLRVLTQLFLFGQLPILFGATSSWQGPVGPWRLAMRPGSQIGHGMSQDAICSSWRPISFEAKAICTLVQVTFAMYDHWFPLEMRQEKFTSNNFWCRCVAWGFCFVVWLLKKPFLN